MIGIDKKNEEIESGTQIQCDDSQALMSKSDFIITECENFIKQIRRSLSNLLIFREELKKAFQENRDIIVRFDNVFREIEPLQLLYKIINDHLNIFKKRSQFCLADLFLHREIRGSLIFHKSFLSQYSANAKWIGQFYKSDQICRRACDRAIDIIQSESTVNLENCLYTIFNSLFAFELMFDRYSKCFEVNHVNRTKAEEVISILRDILQQSSDVQNQENFFQTQKELNLLNGRTTVPKVNTEFILKDLAVKYSQKESKELSRQLVLFSDGLFVTTPPGNINGTSRVRQELSFKFMEISVICEDEMKPSNRKWGLNINALEANTDFYFENEEKMLMWRNKLEISIKNDNRDLVNNLNINVTPLASLGEVAPDWQRDNIAEFCNGLNCSLRFTHTMRRHHCRSDGLLYCDSCSSFKLKLPYGKESESRICELCFRILHRDLHDPKSLEDAKKQLSKVFSRKTRKGIKLNWLHTRIYNSDKTSFSSPIQYFCELDESDPFLKLYKNVEDKIRHREIILLGMFIRTGIDSKYCKKLKPTQFTIEHQDRQEAYLFKASSAENCKEWVDCLQDSIRNHFQDK